MAPLCPAPLELAETVEPEELVLTAELEEPEGLARLVVEPAVVWAWRRPVETAVLAARAALDLMRVDFRMDRLVATLAREAPVEPAARPARLAQMRRPLLAVMAEPEEMPEAPAQVLREWQESMAPLGPAQVASEELEEPEELELTAEREEPAVLARLAVEPAVVWAWRRPVETAVLAARAALDLMRVDFRMDRLVATLAREAPVEPAARPARWAQMRHHWLAVMAVRAAWVAMAARAAMA